MLVQVCSCVVSQGEGRVKVAPSQDHFPAGVSVMRMVI